MKKRNSFIEVLKRISPVLLLLLIFSVLMRTERAGQRTGLPDKMSAAENRLRAEFGVGAKNPQKNGEKAEGDGALVQYPLTESVFLLDTFCTLTIYQGGGRTALEHAKELLLRFHTLLDPKGGESSDICRINHRESGEVEISPETAELLRAALFFSEQSGGSFDPGIGLLSEFWDVRHRTEPPEPEEIEGLREQSAGQCFAIRQDRDGTPVFVTGSETLRVDAGAIAKGFIADRLKEQMEKDGVESAIINLGGNVLCIGRELPGGRPFRIGLKKPERASAEELAVLEIDGLSVVTAGAYERYFEADGVRYHHILDPKTGFPARTGLAAVTVIGPRSQSCDALSTTLFIKGYEEGLRFLSAYNRENKAAYQAVFIFEDETIAVSEGAEALFTKAKGAPEPVWRNVQ